ncbi:MAG: hypothetical protein ABWZ98_02045 [Nakamurella sp.]
MAITRLAEVAVLPWLDPAALLAAPDVPAAELPALDSWAEVPEDAAPPLSELAHPLTARAAASRAAQATRRPLPLPERRREPPIRTSHYVV